MTVTRKPTMAPQRRLFLPLSDGVPRLGGQGSLIEDRTALPGRAATNVAPVIPAGGFSRGSARGARTVESDFVSSHLLPGVPRSNTVIAVPVVTHSVLSLS